MQSAKLCEHATSISVQLFWVWRQQNGNTNVWAKTKALGSAVTQNKRARAQQKKEDTYHGITIDFFLKANKPFSEYLDPSSLILAEIHRYCVDLPDMTAK